MTLISEAFISILIVYLFLRSYLNLSLSRTQAEPFAALNRKSSTLLSLTRELYCSSYSYHFYSCTQRPGPRNLFFGFVSLVHRYMVGYPRREIGSLPKISTYRRKKLAYKCRYVYVMSEIRTSNLRLQW